MSRPYMLPSQSDEWRTPPDLFERLNRTHRFDVDAAASRENALLPRYWDRDADALMQDWTGLRIYCNPPYTAAVQDQFVRKAAERLAEVAVLLLPARTDTRRWHDWIFGVADDIEFLRGRLSFSGAGAATFPSAIVTWRAAA